MEVADTEEAVVWRQKGDLTICVCIYIYTSTMVFLFLYIESLTQTRHPVAMTHSIDRLVDYEICLSQNKLALLQEPNIH